MKLYTIFVNYNSGKQLYNGVVSILKSPSVSGIIVIDNNSADDSLSHLNNLNAEKPMVIIKNSNNVGFYKALNIGIKKALGLGADRIMPLDFDLGFDFDFISSLLKVDADVVAPVLKSKLGGKWCYDYGGRFHWIKGTSYHNIKDLPQKRIGVIYASGQHNNPSRFDFVSGGCTIFRKEIFLRTGYFDEDYFLYWGDADFIYQAHKLGFKVAVDGNTIVHHKLELSRQTGNMQKLKRSFFDNATFIRKRVKPYFWPFAYLSILSLSIKVLLIRIKFTLIDKNEL
jgi:GT2 family glycosyltransferase